MQDTWSRVQIVALIAVTAVLTVVVFNWAANATAGAAPTQGAAPAAQQDTLPIQDTQTQPAPPQGDGDPDDCPERDGRGPGDGGPGGGPASEAPQTSTSQPTELQPEV